MTSPKRVPLRRIAGDLRPQSRTLLLGSLAAVMVAVASAAGPVLIGLVIDEGVVAGEVSWVVLGTLGFLLASVVQLVSQWLQIRWMGRFSHDYMRSLRRQLIGHLFGLDLDFFARVRTGRLVSRLTSDVENLQQFVENGLVLIVRAAMIISFTVVAMLIVSPLLTGVASTVILPLALVTLWFRRHAFVAQTKVRDRMADLLGHVSESLNGARVIQAFTHEDFRRDAFHRANDGTFRAKDRTFRLNARFYGSVEFLQTAALAAVIAVGALHVTGDGMTVGAVVAFTIYLGRLFEPIQQLTEVAQLFQQAAASYGKLFEFRDTRPQVQDAPGARDYCPGGGDIRIEAATFRYDPHGPNVIRDVTLRIPAGQRVALVGRSGAGKSTIAKLIARSYDVSSGRVLVDGQDVRDVTGGSLRRHVVLVPQEGFLFSGTVAENIAAAREGCDRREVEAACDRLGIRTRLEGLPNGLDTEVAGGGLSLSSGQRQLIALGRALIADPQVLILDEATSNLDPDTDRLVEHALETLLVDRTAIIIAHRVGTALRADRVVMMTNGRITEDGTPSQLVAAGGAFSEWAAQADAGASNH